jgi:hypothetical protein
MLLVNEVTSFTPSSKKGKSMSRTLIAITVLLLLFIRPLLADNQHLNHNSAESDKQIALDLRDLNLDKFLDASTDMVAFVKLTPSPTAGKFLTKTTVGDFLNPKTGVVDHAVQRTVLEGWDVSGLYEVYNLFTQKALGPASHYQWIAPYRPIMVP